MDIAQIPAAVRAGAESIEHPVELHDSTLADMSQALATATTTAAELLGMTDRISMRPYVVCQLRCEGEPYQREASTRH